MELDEFVESLTYKFRVMGSTYKVTLSPHLCIGARYLSHLGVDFRDFSGISVKLDMLPFVRSSRGLLSLKTH